MKTVVIDASAAVKWFLPEEGAEHAAALLSGAYRLIAPDLLWVEVAAVLWKVARRGGLSADEVQRIIADAAAFPVETAESSGLLPEALRIAMEADRTVYDSLYLALAVRERTAVVTADDRFVNALRGTRWSKNITPLAIL